MITEIYGKKNLETRRQFFHMLIGTVFALLIYFQLINWIFLSLFLIFLLLMASIHKKNSLKSLQWLLTQLERPKVIPGAGAIQMVFGILITSLLFDNYKIVSAAILILAFGDSISTFIGKKYGEIKLVHNKRKSLEGSISGFLAALIVTTPIVGIELAFLGSFVGMFFESFNDRIGVDDNIIIPITAAIAMWLVI